MNAEILWISWAMRNTPIRAGAYNSNSRKIKMVMIMKENSTMMKYYLRDFT